MDYPEVMGSRCLILEEDVAAAIKEMKKGKAAAVVSEGSWWFWFKVDD